MTVQQLNTLVQMVRPAVTEITANFAVVAV